MQTASIIRPTAKLTGRYRLVDLEHDDPRIVLLLNRYRRAFGMTPGTVPNDGARWYGLLYDDKLAVAASARPIENGAIEVLNVCPVRGRYGIFGVYVLLRLLREMVDQKVVTAIVCSTLYKNQAMIRALAKAFGRSYRMARMTPEPRALVFVYGDA